MFLFLKRLLVHTFTFLFVLLPLQIIGAIILIFVCPFMAPDRLRLPSCLKWFDNADDYLGRDTSVYELICSHGWWSRYCWLAWRNPINYYGYVINGLRWEGNELYSRYSPAEDDIGDASRQRPGLKHIEILKPIIKDGHLSYARYFEYYWIYRYPFKRDVCFRFRLGWKIKDSNNPKGSISQWVFVISPWKSYSGK